MINHSTQSRLVTWTTPCLTILFMMGLLAFHVHAENPVETPMGGLWMRITSGPDALTSLDKVLFVAFILLGMEILSWVTEQWGKWVHAKQIPVRGKHLDVLRPIDRLFIAISKAQTGPFVYFLLRYCYFEPNVLWRLEEISLKTVVLPLPVVFIVFDFFYTTMHWALHIKAIYGYIHKHHHHQKAPSRANVDAINVHPIEFFLGEYNHIWSLFLCCATGYFQIHILGVFLFLVTGGILAGLNHTRFDLVVPFLGIKIFDSKAHDVHHRIPQANYGQFTMFWDYIFGSYRSYDPNDRVNPKAQLDPKTGMSLDYYTKPEKTQ